MRVEVSVVYGCEFQWRVEVVDVRSTMVEIAYN